MQRTRVLDPMLIIADNFRDVAGAREGKGGHEHAVLSAFNGGAQRRRGGGRGCVAKVGRDEFDP